MIRILALKGLANSSSPNRGFLSRNGFFFLKEQQILTLNIFHAEVMLFFPSEKGLQKTLTHDKNLKKVDVCSIVSLESIIGDVE